MDFETYEKNQTPPIDWEYHYESNNEKGDDLKNVYKSKNWIYQKRIKRSFL